MIRIWLRAARVQFFTASALPVVLGTLVAGYEIGNIFWSYFFIMLIGVLACHAGTNLFNDYYDHLNGTDDINRNRSLFNGGSGCIQEGLVPAGSIKKAAFIFYLISLLTGIYFIIIYGYPILLYITFGLISGYCYSGYPNLSCRGIGELLVGINFGPVIVTAANFVQTGHFSFLALFVSVPIGLLIAAVLYINQFPDYDADEYCGKANWVVRLGLDTALPFYYILLALAYIIIISGVFLEMLPAASLLAFVTFPFAVLAVLIARKWRKHPAKILPSNILTVAIHFGISFVLAAIFAWEFLIKLR